MRCLLIIYFAFSFAIILLKNFEVSSLLSLLLLPIFFSVIYLGHSSIVELSCTQFLASHLYLPASVLQKNTTPAFLFWEKFHEWEEPVGYNYGLKESTWPSNQLVLVRNVIAESVNPSLYTSMDLECKAGRVQCNHGVRLTAL